VPEAADLLPRVLRPGDVVLLKGSRSAGVERLAEAAL
jgi:UDP-N-acetylmuramoyl-tripeptide--D-alanyl-D-alanine ligase